MRKMARAAVATVAAVVMTPVVAYAEPMVLTATQMDSVTAAARAPRISLNINITTQIANATAFSVAICGICTGGVPAASSFAAAINANDARQIAR
jgi:hypothetical protein